MVTPRRTVLALAAVGVLLAASTGTATADDPWSGVPPAVADRAERVLDSAPGDRAPQVLITTRASPGARPEFTTVPVDDRADGLQTIAAALQDDDTAAVDMVQPARIAAQVNDPLRRQQSSLNMLRPEITAWPYSRGKGVKVAVVDSGVMIGHRDFQGRVTRGRDLVDPGTPADDTNGHGTHVAGLIAAGAGNKEFIAGWAPAATIVPVRVLGSDGTGSTDDVATGIVWAVDQGVQVINLSLTLKQSAAVEAAVEYAVGRNVVVVGAAGNAGCSTTSRQTPVYPAAYPGVIGVGALRNSTAIAPYSACGSWVDVVVLGTGVPSLTIKYPRVSGCQATRYWCRLSGTSMAAPQIAGIASLRIARTGVSRYDARTVAAQVLGSTSDLGTSGRDDRYGYGRINVKKLLTR